MDLLGFFGFDSAVQIEIKFHDQDTRRTIDKHGEKAPQRLLVYVGDEPVRGVVTANVKAGKKVEHEGLKIELVGEIGVVYDRGNHYEFIKQVQEVSTGGVLQGNNTYEFDFTTEKEHESYNGLNVRLRYFIRFSVVKGFGSNITKEQEFWVINYQQHPELNNSIKMEVGIEDCLHIEFEYARAKYHLKDVILGKIYFLLVRIKIKYMEIALVKRESTGTAPNVYNESETLTKFEIMDGAPVRGESIPVRLFLGAFDLTPTYKNTHNKFSVKYFLNLVLVDEEDRRYFKQTDIFLWRKHPGTEEAHKVITVKDANESLAAAKKKRRKNKKQKKDKTNKQDTAEDKDGTTPAGKEKPDDDDDDDDEKDAV